MHGIYYILHFIDKENNFKLLKLWQHVLWYKLGMVLTLKINAQGPDTWEDILIFDKRDLF